MFHRPINSIYFSLIKDYISYFPFLQSSYQDFIEYKYCISEYLRDPICIIYIVFDGLNTITLKRCIVSNVNFKFVQLHVFSFKRKVHLFKITLIKIYISFQQSRLNIINVTFHFSYILNKLKELLHIAIVALVISLENTFIQAVGMSSSNSFSQLLST